ncbi:alkyl hydroperoxide reductase, subunit C, partial [Lacticaseibacillus rhamnosus MTCC 5462]
CPTELGDLQDHYDRFKAAGAEIYSASEDTEFVHMAWAETSPTIKKIQYPMLADPAGKLATALDVRDEASGQAFRGTFIIDPDGVIQAYVVNNFGIGRNADEILRTLQAAQFVAAHGDQVCPANWQPGEKTLKPGADLVGKLYNDYLIVNAPIRIYSRKKESQRSAAIPFCVNHITRAKG